MIHVRGEFKIAAQTQDVKTPVGGPHIPSQRGRGQGSADQQVDLQVDLLCQVVLHHESVAQGAHTQAKSQVLQQRHTGPDRPRF